MLCTALKLWFQQLMTILMCSFQKVQITEIFMYTKLVSSECVINSWQYIDFSLKIHAAFLMQNHSSSLEKGLWWTLLMYSFGCFNLKQRTFRLYHLCWPKKETTPSSSINCTIIIMQLPPTKNKNCLSPTSYQHYSLPLFKHGFQHEWLNQSLDWEGTSTFKNPSF